MWKIALLLIVAAASLFACDSETKRREIFVTRCAGAGFTILQCSFLFAMAEKAASDADDSAALGSATGTAVGMSMNAGGR